MDTQTDVSQTIDERLAQIETECSQYLDSLGIKIRHNPEFDRLLSFNLDGLRILDEEECAEYSVLAALYSTYIQTEFNRHSRRIKWANHNLDIVVGKYAKNYGTDYTKYEEKRACIICEISAARKLNEVLKEATCYAESINFISRKLESISNTLLELKRSKRKQQ